MSASLTVRPRVVTGRSNVNSSKYSPMLASSAEADAMEARDATPPLIDELDPHACSRLKPPVSKVDTTPGNDLYPRYRRAFTGSACPSHRPGSAFDPSRPKSAVPAAFDLLELNGQDTARH
jgi:hypothetical protein